MQARGLGADEQALGDLPVRQPLADQLEHLGLARGEARARPAPRARRSPSGAGAAAPSGTRARRASASSSRAHQLGAERARLLVGGAQRVGARAGARVAQRRLRAAASPRRPPGRARRPPPRRRPPRATRPRCPRPRPARPRRAPPRGGRAPTAGSPPPATSASSSATSRAAAAAARSRSAGSAGRGERRLGLDPHPHREQRRRVEQLARPRASPPGPRSTSSRASPGRPVPELELGEARVDRGHVLGRRALAQRLGVAQLARGLLEPPARQVQLARDLAARDRVPRLQVAVVELRQARLGVLPAPEQELVRGRVERQEAPERGLHPEPPRVALAVARDLERALEVAEQPQRLGEVEVGVEQVLRAGRAPRASAIARAQVGGAGLAGRPRRRRRARAPCARRPPRPPRRPPPRPRAPPPRARAPPSKRCSAHSAYASAPSSRARPARSSSGSRRSASR